MCAYCWFTLHKTHDFNTHYKGYQILGNINDAFISTVQCNTHLEIRQSNQVQICVA